MDLFVVMLLLPLCWRKRAQIRANPGGLVKIGLFGGLTAICLRERLTGVVVMVIGVLFITVF